MTDHVQFAYALSETGQGELLEGKAIVEALESESLAWVHLDANNEHTLPWLQATISYLDPFICHALVAEETRPRMTAIGDGFLLILRGVNLNDQEDPEDMVSIRLWVDPHRIVSLERRPVRAIQDLATQLTQGKGPRDAGTFVCSLIYLLCGRMEPVIGTLDDATDALEEELLAEPTTTMRERIVDVRRQAIVFRRHMAPQRDAINHLRMANVPWLNETSQRQLFESYNLVIRYVEDLDAVRERAQIVKDELGNILADRLNRNLYLLSVITAIFLPLGFLTGLFGINLGGIPGADTANAFGLFCGALAVVIVLQVFLFKLFKWF